MTNFNIKYINEEEYEKWNNFVECSPQGTLFSRTQWLEGVCSDFKILVAEENNKIVGGITLPNIRGKLYRNPKLTPQLGILLSQASGKIKYSKQLSKDTEIITALIENLPKSRQFHYNFSYNFNNFLPFIWSGYKVSVSYTYVIDDLKDMKNVYSNFQYDTKYSINRAIKNNIEIVSDFGIDEFYEVNNKTFKRQGIEMPYSLDFLRKLDKILSDNNCRKILFGIDESGKILAGAYIVYDKKCAYYLMGGCDPEYRSTGVQTLLLWESIKFASEVSAKFDFEGSNIKNIEKYFRKFGGEQKIIHSVNKTDFITSAMYKLLKKNKNIIRKIFKV